MRIGSLFSGYGGLDLAVTSVLGGEVVWHVEYDKAPSAILDHHFPGVPNYGDVTQIDWAAMPPVDILTGGYPCQPFSHAGKRKGTNDERHLWPYVRDALRDLGPRFALLENVRGHLTLGFDTVLADLADIGWSAEWVTVRASDAGAPHQRERLFILAYPDESGSQGSQPATRHELPAWGAAPDADVPGSEARGDAGHDSERLRVEPVGHHDSPPDASSERHGRGQDGRTLERLDRVDEGQARQRERSRPLAGDRGAATLADAGRGSQPGTAQRGDGLLKPAECGSGTPADAISSRRDGRAPDPQWGPERGVAATGSGEDAAPDAGDGASDGQRPRPQPGQGGAIAWGEYAPAISRWARVLGRPAPLPTEPGRTGSPRLSPAFVEWMMGLPAGWVTDPAIGIGRNAQLKALGNGVVPQQGALALRILLERLP